MRSATVGTPSTLTPRPPVLLRYLHCPHRRREVTPRRQPIPQLVQVPFQVLLKLLDRLAVDAGRAVIGLDPLIRLPDHPFGNRERLVLRLWFAHPAPPTSRRLTTKRTRTTRPLRSTRITRLHRYYETVRPCAPHRYSAPRSFGCLGFSLGRPRGRPPRPAAYRGDRFPRSIPEPETKLAPPPCRTPPGQSAGSPPDSSRGNDSPRFRRHRIRFRHVISGSLTFAFLAHT